MIRFRALDRYKRHYLHAIRNGKTSEMAADEAMARTKIEVQGWLAEDQSLTEGSKRELWGNIFSVLIEWQALLDDVAPTASPQALGLKVSSLDKSEEAERLRNCPEKKSHDSNRLGVSSSNSDSPNQPDSSAGSMGVEAQAGESSGQAQGNV